MIKRITAILLTLVLCLMPVASVFAEEDTSSDTTAATSTEQAAKVAELEAKIEEVTAQVNEYNSQISELEKEIAQTEEELEQAEAKRSQQEEDLKERMRAIYMYGNDGYLEMMFSAQNLTDLLTYFDLSRNIMSADKTMQTQLVNTKKVIASYKSTLEQDKNSVEQAKADSEKVQEELGAELKENQELLANLQLQENYSGQTATVAAVNASALAASGWTWPVDANATNAFLITSLMGTRESPGGVGSTDHGGTDIGCGYGSTIVAAQAGTVTQAGSNGGYGNCVTVQTTDGYTTMYGHLSAIYVSEGQTVAAGQSLGACGSTGNSTGPHLHFEVRSGSSKINGLSFYGNDIIAKLSYALDA